MGNQLDINWLDLLIGLFIILKMLPFFLTVKTGNNAKRDASCPALLKTIRNIEIILIFG